MQKSAMENSQFHEFEDIVGQYFREHCTNKGILLIDCKTVTDQLVRCLSQRNEVSEQFWEIQDGTGNATYHWVPVLNEYIIDLTIIQFFVMGDVLQEQFRIKWGCQCFIEGQRRIHPPWVYHLIEDGLLYKKFKDKIIEKPYFIGKTEDHPLLGQSFAVLRSEIKHLL